MHAQGKGLASRGNSTYRRSLVVEKTALRASPALLPLMSTLYVCCSTRSLAMLVSSSTIRLPFCPHRHSLRASPGSVFTAHSAASVPKSFFHRHVLPVRTVTVCLSRYLKSFKVSKAVYPALSTLLPTRTQPMSALSAQDAASWADSFWQRQLLPACYSESASLASCKYEPTLLPIALTSPLPGNAQVCSFSTQRCP